MSELFDYIANNASWIFSGIGASVMVTYGALLLKRKKQSSPNTLHSVKASQSIQGANLNNSTVVNVNTLPVNNIDTMAVDTVKAIAHGSGASKAKADVSILFIDDQHAEFQMVQILKQAGWKNTKAVKDITDLDDAKVRGADIIFVDINGVGKKLSSDEGRGLARTLKARYPRKKIVLYSAESRGDIFDKTLEVVDAKLPKNADPLQFLECLENLARGIQ